MPRSFSFGLGAVTALLAFSFVSAASAASLTVPWSGKEIVGGDNPGYLPSGTATFTWDEFCVGDGVGSGFCGLRITLTALPTASGAAPSQGEVLAGILFEPHGTDIDFRDGPPGNVPFGGTAGASALVGNGNVIAAGDLGSVAINGTTLNNVSSHWGLNPAMAMPSGFGTHYLASVGDVFAGLNITTSTLSSMQLFGNTPSSVEPSPPNGISFGILDVNSLPNGGFPAGNLAFIQATLTVNLLYEGTLTDINLVQPVYGTDGNPLVPEPSTALLLGFGLLGMLTIGRRNLQRRTG